MATYDTPNYLGFAAQMPKESPLLGAIQSGMQTYGSLQDIGMKKEQQKLAKEQTELMKEKSKQSKMETEAMPSKIQRTKETEEQTIEKGKLELSTARDAILENMLTDAISYEQHDPTGKMSAQYYEQVKKKAKILGIDTEGMPEKWGSEARAFSLLSSLKTPAAISTRKEQHEILLKQIEAYGKYNAVKLKAELKKIYDKKLTKPQEYKEKLDIKYLEEELPKAASISTSIINNINEMERIEAKNNWFMGPKIVALGEYLPGKMSGDVNRYNQKGAELVTEMLTKTPGAYRGAVALLRNIQKTKVEASDPKETRIRKLAEFKTVAMMDVQKMEFANLMSTQGITSKMEIESSWDKFILSESYKDKNGYFHPEEIEKWQSWYNQHPEALPRLIQDKLRMTKMMESGTVEKQVLPITEKQAGQIQSNLRNAGIKTVATTPNAPLSVAYNGGIIPNYAPGQTPRNLLEG